MENFSGKQKPNPALKIRESLEDISNKILNASSNRSRLDPSDSENLESGIISRCQSPNKSLNLETNTLTEESMISEVDFLAATLRSNHLFLSEKLRSSFASPQDSESTMTLKKSELLEIGFCSTVFCENCSEFVQTVPERVSPNPLISFILKLLPLCDCPELFQKRIVQKCSNCYCVLGRGNV